MSKQKELAKNTAIIMAGRVCTQFISFFLLPLYTTILTTSEYGIVDLLVAYASLFIPLITLAIEQALFRYLIDVRANLEEEKNIISTAIIFSVAQSTIFFIILSIVQIFSTNIYLPLFNLMIVACISSTTMLQLCRGLGDNVGYALGGLITAIVQIGCNIFYLVVLNLGVKGMLLATFSGNIACTVFLIFKTHIYNYVHLKSFKITILKDMLRYSVPLIPNQLSWWIMNASDKIIVSLCLGVTFNGLLAVSHKFSGIYIQFSNIFNISWTESATLHINDKDANVFFSEIINSVFKLFACINMSIIVCIPFIFKWLVNDNYYAAYYQIPIFMLASLCNVVVSLYGVIYVAHKKTKEITFTALYAAIINIVTHLILVRFSGLYAASISSLLGYGTMAIYRYFHSRRYLIIKFSNKLLISISLLFVIAIFSYYTSNFIYHFIAFILVFWGCIALNINLIKKVLLIRNIRKYKSQGID